MRVGHHDVLWVDGGREPKEEPDPDYPKGIDLDMTGTQQSSCTVSLPYPARRIGYYVVVCSRCLLRVSITTAGRPDDPRSARLPCQVAGRA